MLYFQIKVTLRLARQKLACQRASKSARRGAEQMISTTRRMLTVFLALGLLAGSQARADDAKVLRIITWADYVPAEVIAQFRKETGIQIQVTLSNNEEMISKLRATGGAGFDLAQPSQDRILGPQQEFGIYKPFDMSKVKTELFIPAML